jgi:hypothetical protein
MSTAQVTAVSQHERTVVRLRNFATGSLFALVLLIPRLLRIRQNPGSWFAFRMILGFAGAALVVLPLSLWNSWLVAPLGLCMFLASILLPPAKPHLNVDEKAEGLGALIVVNGGLFPAGKTDSTPVQLFIGPDHIWALDSNLEHILAIPTAELTSAEISPLNKDWLLQIRWSNNLAEFSYQGIFAQHLAQVAQTTLAPFVPAILPILQKSRAATA